MGWEDSLIRKGLSSKHGDLKSMLRIHVKKKMSSIVMHICNPCAGEAGERGTRDFQVTMIPCQRNKIDSI